MDSFIQGIQKIRTAENAVKELEKQTVITAKLKELINFIIKAHQDQFRKSGEPYCIHPILVACLAAHFSKDESVIATALLHDVVEDTHYSLDYIKNNWGNDIAKMVDGLTKIVEIREHELAPSNLTSDKNKDKVISSALTFRKMLVASVDDVRVLVIKLCDRLHNMLTLDALPRIKQKRIAEETLVVYVPIANRLGISTLKNDLEDLAFRYIYPLEYSKIDSFLKEQQHAMQLSFNNFISTTKDLLERNGYNKNKIKIYSRIKHHYSIYLKMQRKGITIDEVLDLFAIRIIVENDIDCYKVLGYIHLQYSPLLSRFKDYIATPKENGYRTIHTTIFHNSKIYEIQIRTSEMHNIAEFGIAAHWKYKSGEKSTTSLNWLKSLEFSNTNVEEFYEEAKDSLYAEDIVVYSPKGEIFDLPVGATALDFAYAVHTDIGKKATSCYINKIKKPLLTELKNTDIVRIELAPNPIARCSWVNLVKTSRAKKQMKLLCAHKNRIIDKLSGKNIINTVFSRYTKNITGIYKINSIYKIPQNLDHLKHTKIILQRKLIRDRGFVTRFKILSNQLKEYKFDNILIYSNFSINSVSFDYCCHPKFGDGIVAFKEGNTAIIHHKMCDHAYEKINNGKEMLFCTWTNDMHYQYKMVVSLSNSKGELSKLLNYMARYEIYILSVDFGRQKHSYRQYCDIEFEINISSLEDVKKLIEKKVKVLEFYSKKDAYTK